MYEPGNGRPSSEVRGMALMLIQETEGVKLTTLAKELGRDPSALSRAAQRIRKRMREDEAMKDKYEEIVNALNKKSFNQA